MKFNSVYQLLRVHETVNENLQFLQINKLRMVFLFLNPSHKYTEKVSVMITV
jgi:hypothetical protein